MGEVWRARDSRLQREVAIKVLPAEVASDAGRLKRFEKEARSASALNHPNIVTIYDIGQSDSVSWISMELVEGKTLQELLFAGLLPIKRVAGGERRRLPGVLPSEYVLSWSEDGRAVYATVFGKLPFQIYRVDVATGRRELWKTITPSDPTGVYSSDLILLSNGSYVLNVKRWLSDLYLVEGLK